MTAFVHKGHTDLQAQTIFEAQHPVEYHHVQTVPGSRVVRTAHDDSLLNAPGLPEMAVADDLILKAVVLCVHAGGQDEDALRQLRIVDLPAAQHCLRVLRFAPVLPQLAEAGVIDHLHLGCVALGVQELQNRALPAGPGTDKGVEPKRTDAPLIGVRVLGDPLGRLASDFRLSGGAGAAWT